MTIFAFVQSGLFTLEFPPLHFEDFRIHFSGTISLLQSKSKVNKSKFKLFVKSLQDLVNKSKNAQKPFWPDQNTKNRFCKRYNLKYKKVSTTLYRKQGLMCQLVPSLEMTFALRELYGIEGGKGQIWNLDESMTYRVVKDSQSWQF